MNPGGSCFSNGGAAAVIGVAVGVTWAVEGVDKIGDG